MKRTLSSDDAAAGKRRAMAKDITHLVESHTDAGITRGTAIPKMAVDRVQGTAEKVDLAADDRIDPADNLSAPWHRRGRPNPKMHRRAYQLIHRS